MLNFIFTARKEGMTKDEAILQSVRLRIRPVLMTTVSAFVGLTSSTTTSPLPAATGTLGTS